MKSVVKPLSIIAAVAYVAGIIITAIYLYRLPVNLTESSGVLDIVSVKEIQPVINQLTTVLALVLAAGMAALILQVLKNTNGEENVVYVEKFRDNAGPETKHQQETEDGITDTSSLTQDIIEKIKQAASGNQEPDKVLEKALRTVCLELEASQGAVYVAKESENRRFLELKASFAYIKPDSQSIRFEFGEGLPGQAAKEGNISTIEAVPDGYIKILSGLGKASPNHLMLVPVKTSEKILGVVEIASFTRFTKTHQEITQQAFSLLNKQFSQSSDLINTSAEAFEEFEEKSQNI